jgi:perosamine synthetase
VQNVPSSLLLIGLSVSTTKAPDANWPEPERSLKIPLAKPDLGLAEKRNLMRAYRSTQISGMGYFVEKSENQISEILQTQALVVSNGSVAITLALRALGVGVGDEVIVPSLTYAATASAVVNIGATPRFVDSDLESWNIRAEDVARVISSRTKAILVVDLYGNPAEMLKIHNLAQVHKLAIIQDSAEAFGAKYLGNQLGKYADISTYSFFANKIITCGEGGAVTTNNTSLLNKMRLLRGQGMSQTSRYFFEEAGYNFRLSNLSASILSAQLARSNELIEKRLKVFEKYRRYLEIEALEPKSPLDSNLSPWLFSVRLPGISLIKKRELATLLAKQGIQTRPLFYPLSSMPAFESWVDKSRDEFYTANLISNQGISLPTFPRLRTKQIREICKLVNNSHKN